MSEKSKIVHNFVPPAGPSPAELQMQAMKEAFGNLPKEEQDEIKHVKERLDFLRAKYASSADLAIVYASLEISKERGQ